MKNEDDYGLTPGAVIGLLIFFTVLIGGTVLCFIWEEYGILIGFGFCWLLTFAFMVRGAREAVNAMSKNNKEK